jgi:hypothetical protein
MLRISDRIVMTSHPIAQRHERDHRRERRQSENDHPEGQQHVTLLPGTLFAEPPHETARTVFWWSRGSPGQKAAIEAATRNGTWRRNRLACLADSLITSTLLRLGDERFIVLLLFPWMSLEPDAPSHRSDNGEYQQNHSAHPDNIGIPA